MDDSDTRGMLTDTDQKWLNDEVEYGRSQTAAERREAIRTRVALALDDFKLLTENWSSDESEKVYEELDSPEELAAEIIEFLYVFLNEPATDATRMMDESATETPLAFRRALRRGIRSGKEHFDDDPDTVLLDSNTELFELPSVEELNEVIDTDQWRDANAYSRGAGRQPDDSVIEQSSAAEIHHMDLHLEIENELYRRRKSLESEINRHDELVQPLLRSEESEE